jgi:hypothetical protein
VIEARCPETSPNLVLHRRGRSVRLIESVFEEPSTLTANDWYQGRLLHARPSHAWPNGGAFVGTLEPATVDGKPAVHIRFYKVN